MDLIELLWESNELTIALMHICGMIKWVNVKCLEQGLVHRQCPKNISYY